MHIRVGVDVRSLTTWAHKMASDQVPYATAVALNKTAQLVRDAEKAEMQRVFDRPTRFTLNSVWVKRATKQSQEAIVWLKDDYGTRAHYLMPQIEGGGRPLKRFEQRLVSLGAMRPGERAVPGKGVPLDAHGNLSRGLIVKILSQVGSRGFHGDYSVKSDSRRSKAKRASEAYFVSTGPGGTLKYMNGEPVRVSGRTHRLARGVWMRKNFAQGSAVRPVLLFVARAHYNARFKFYDVARQVIGREFEGQFRLAMQSAIDSAR